MADGPVLAMDYVSVADDAAILYDAPSLKAKKVYVISRYSPLEEIVNLSNWVKVRDSSGTLAWIEKRALSSKHFVAVSVPLAVVHQAPNESAAELAQAKAQVALEWLEDTGVGWLKINLPGGVTGYVKTADVWGN
ncbi:MAG: SH3 domain-containing protein [Gallionellaceae bacterium]